MMEKVKSMIDTTYKPYMSDNKGEGDNKEPQSFQTTKGEKVLKKFAVFCSQVPMPCVVPKSNESIPTAKNSKYHVIPNATYVIFARLMKEKKTSRRPQQSLFMNLWFKQILPYLVLVIFHLNSGQVDNQVASPSRDQPAKLPQVLYRPPGAPFGPVHFTEYPPNPAYLEYDLETILIADPLARTRSTKYIGREGKRIKIPPLLFKDNVLCSHDSAINSKTRPPTGTYRRSQTTSTQLFGVLCITLTGLMDSMVPNSGPWSLLIKFVSYIIKLAPILWWALPASLAAPHPKPPNASTYDWLPDNLQYIHENSPENIKYHQKYAKTVTALKEKGTIKFFYIDKSSFLLSMRNEYGYVHKGEMNSTSWRAAVWSVAYSMVVLLGPLDIELYQMIKGSIIVGPFWNFSNWFRSTSKCKDPTIREVLEKKRGQVGYLEPCERCHNWIDHHHQSKVFGVYVIASEITSKIREYVIYIGVYGYGLDGVGQYQRGPGVPLGGVDLRWLLVVVIAR
ncbi:hypothetical protein DSO57_1015125 [Entomophthora muscae]|uniref:Uncharacterized protein n=1 Tax=Entomophthora muscae TaxID=34485 RepID=A0ACC2SUF3_9FUNG|nr:hypothetical protein DSO57_1015125 [Entomophthora muscae]